MNRDDWQAFVTGLALGFPALVLLALIGAALMIAGCASTGTPRMLLERECKADQYGVLLCERKG